MLDHVTIKNFRCLREVSVPLKPLTVLIGENDSGKSTFMEAVLIAAEHEYSGDLADADHWRGETEIPIEATFKNLQGVTSLGPTIYLDDEGTVTRGAPAGCPRRDRDGGAFDRRRGVYRIALDPFRLRFSGEQSATGRRTGPIDSGGSNVPAVLDQMLRTHRREFDVMEKRCRDLVPGFESFSLILPDPGVVSLDLRDESGFDYPNSRASAGVRALILYLTLAYRPDAPDIVLVEEPENGLHPRRLGEVMGLLRLLTEPKADGRRTQVIVTTHSPYLLDHIDLETDQVLVFRREEGGARTAEPIDADGLKTYLRDFMLGEIWDSVGERGLVRPAEFEEDGATVEPMPADPTVSEPVGVGAAAPVGAAA